MIKLLEKLEDQLWDYDDGSDGFAEIVATVAELRTAIEAQAEREAQKEARIARLEQAANEHRP